ncbi:MAG TPA: ATP-binding protein [Fibrobacteres bacterium]|nr:ATP-binding protein [Fibrobacterota bacterium]
MKRSIDKVLKEWKDKPDRLVLLLRGARQVGKTYSARVLGAMFSNFLEINFEEQAQTRIFFEGDLNVHEICEKFSAYSGVPIVPGETLVFFDEVQACPGCLRALRFFHEKMPGLHVIAAGSLLEFAISEIPSFGVGRISSFFMYPMSFMEFLHAEGSELLADYVLKNGVLKPLDKAIHDKLLERLRIFLMIGGMPAVVDAYCKSRNLIDCMEILDGLLISLMDDLAKYGKKAAPAMLRDTLRAVSHQAGGKFKYAAVGEGLSARETKLSLDILERAGLIYRIYHTAARGIPLGAQINDRRFKIIPLDVGLHQRLLGLDLSEHIVMSHDRMVNRGNNAEIFAGVELIACGSCRRRPEIFYWHREQRDSNAEVDYVIQSGEKILPIEVKSGSRGRMQSLRIFMEERGLDLGVRVSEENFSRYGKITVLPLYAAGSLVSANF